MSSEADSCASAVKRFAGLAPRCGRVWDGNASNASQTAVEAAGLGFISTGLTRIRPPEGGIVSSPFIRAWTTSSTVFLLNFGNRQSRSEEHTSELQSLRHLVCR